MLYQLIQWLGIFSNECSYTPCLNLRRKRGQLRDIFICSQGLPFD